MFWMVTDYYIGVSVRKRKKNQMNCRIISNLMASFLNVWSLILWLHKKVVWVCRSWILEFLC